MIRRYAPGRRTRAALAADAAPGDVAMPAQLTILSVAYPLAPVGPDAVGGAEQVLAAMDARWSRRATARSWSAAAASRAWRLIEMPARSAAQ